MQIRGLVGVCSQPGKGCHNFLTNIFCVADLVPLTAKSSRNSPGFSGSGQCLLVLLCALYVRGMAYCLASALYILHAVVSLRGQVPFVCLCGNTAVATHLLYLLSGRSPLLPPSPKASPLSRAEMSVLVLVVASPSVPTVWTLHHTRLLYWGQ